LRGWRSIPGSIPATSQLDWLISTTAIIVLSWSKATRDLLKSFGWGIRGTLSVRCSDDGAIFLAACPIPSLRWRKADSNCWSPFDGDAFGTPIFGPGLHTVFKNDLVWDAEKLRHLDSVAVVFGSWLPRSDRRCDRYFS
jgi:hypothetical protein